MTDTDDRKQIGMRLPVELVERIDVEAEARHVSRRKLTELLLRDGLDRLRPPASLLAARTILDDLVEYDWHAVGGEGFTDLRDRARAWLAGTTEPAGTQPG